MKPTYSCTGAMLAILAGAVLSGPHGLKAGPRSSTMPKPAVSQANPAQKMRLAENYGKLPLSFEANAGQTDARVKFLSRGRGYALFLTADGAVLSLRKTPVVAPTFRSARPGMPSPSRAEDAGLKPGATGNEGVLALQGNVAQHPPFGAAALPSPSSSRSRVSGTNRTASDDLEKPRDRRTGPALPVSVRDGEETSTALRMRLVGANASAKVTGADELPGKSNYFTGNDPKKWRTNVPTYAKVRYQNVYPGVDLVYYGSQGGQLEYDFVVAPGADPSAIVLGVAAGLSRHRSGKNGGVKPPLQIAADGDLVVNTSGGEVRFNKPVLYQPATNDGQLTTDLGQRTRVDGHYLLNSKHEISFEVAAYDHTKPLVIDPVLSYSTYLGGSTGGDFGLGIALDSSGNAYVTGDTWSTDFPTVNPLQPTNKQASVRPTAFVTKLNAAGSALVYSTYLGGSNAWDPNYFYSGDYGQSIAVDSAGNAYVLGRTSATDFPTVNPIQPSYGGGRFDAFVAKLNSAGSALVYSTYLGGSGEENVVGLSKIAIDPSGNAYVTGDTDSTNFPTTPGAFQTVCGGSCGGGTAFVSKVNASGSALVYSTYLGGSSSDIGNGIAVDSLGNAYVTGYTSSTDFPTANPLQATKRGTFNAFVSKLNAAGSALDYSTYLGGSGYFDQGSGIAVDPSGSAYVAGYTESTDFPTVNPLQPTNHGGDDAFVSKLNAAGSALVYSTYLGGSGNDVCWDIAVDSVGNAYVTGQTRSNDFPTVNPLQATDKAYPYDNAFVAELNAAGSALVYSTYLGGSPGNSGYGITADSSGNAYVTGYTGGYTASDDFPATPGAFQTSFAGGTYDATVTKISPANLPGISLIPSSLTFGGQTVGTTSFVRTIELLNVGSAALNISSIVARGDFAQSNNCGHTVASSASCAINVKFKPKAVGNRSGSISITGNAAGSPQTAALSGVGVGPNVRVTPPSLTFSTQLVSTTSNPKTVTLMNTGNATLNITSVATSGDFGQTNNCGSSVAAGSSCTFSIRFTPTAVGTRVGSLSITDDAPKSPQVIQLTGTGTIVIVSPKSVNFGNQTVGTTSSIQSVAVTNASTTTTLNISGITIGGTNPGDFAFDPTSTCPTTGGTLGPSSACSINLKFTPAATGLRKATVSISDDGGASPQTVLLAGTGK